MGMSTVAARGLFCALFLSLVFRCESLRNGMACDAAPGVKIRNNSCPMASNFCPVYVDGYLNSYRSIDEPYTEINGTTDFRLKIFVGGNAIAQTSGLGAESYVLGEWNERCLEAGSNLIYTRTSIQVVCVLGSYTWYNNMWDIHECSWCISGKYTDTYESSECTACAAGKFSSRRASACTSCPDNSIGPIGSTTVDACECLPGYGFAAQNACEACETGKYKYRSTNTVCTPCPENSTSLVGSTAVSSCLCDSSYAFRTPNRTVTFTDFRTSDGNSVFCDTSYFLGEYKLYGTHDNRPVYKRSTSNHYLWSVHGANWMITSETLFLLWGQKSDIPELHTLDDSHNGHYIFSNSFVYLTDSKGFEDVTEFTDLSYSWWFQRCPHKPGNWYGFRLTREIMSVVDACTNLTTPAPAAPAPSPTPSPTPPAALSPTPPPAAPSPTPPPAPAPPPAAPAAPAASVPAPYAYDSANGPWGRFSSAAPAPRTGWALGMFAAVALLWPRCERGRAV
jgi:hypothetical protein